MLLAGASSAAAQSAADTDHADADSPRPVQASDDSSEKKSEMTRSRATAIAMTQAHGPNGWLERGWRWDMNLDFGYGQAPESAQPWGLMAGGRLGATFVHQPSYLTAGATLYWSQRLDPSVGLQVEYLSDATALWWQGGGFAEFDGELGAMTALGWQLFALEGQVRQRPGDQSAQWAAFAKLRIPVSWFFYIPK